MSERLFSFRWDIDHRVCVTDGLPRIREVCRELGVPNTFFVNMGRSTNLREWLRSAERSRHKLADPESVSLVAKAGWPRFLVETFLSRPVGLRLANRIRALQDDGHELGLHGGLDHVLWSRRFADFDTERLAAEVATSLGAFETAFGKPAGFSAPGFRSDERMVLLLERHGFTYCGDAFGDAPYRACANGRQLQLWTIPVTLAGPRTVPFLEWHGARRTPREAVLAELEAHLAGRRLVVLYGHPCYEGVRDDLLRDVFRVVLDAGFRVVTHRELAERASAGRLPDGPRATFHAHPRAPRPAARSGGRA